MGMMDFTSSHVVRVSEKDGSVSFGLVSGRKVLRLYCFYLVDFIDLNLN